jgi:hypothetical protein
MKLVYSGKGCLPELTFLRNEKLNLFLTLFRPVI